jgi:hypothetical protein
MSKTVEIRNMATVLAELNASVDRYNESTDARERNLMSADHKKLVTEYNELSMLSAYATFMKDATPLIALAKAFYYDTVSVKDTPHNEVVDGVAKSTITRSVTEGNKKLNLVKFIEWTEESNKSVAAGKDWKSKMEAARTVVENEWKAFFAAGGDTHAMSITKAKKALQAMFDSLVFIPCENAKDKNAIIANGDVAKWVLGFSNQRKDSKVDGAVVITGNVLGKQTWATLQMDILHKAVTGKTYDIIFGDPEAEVEEEAAEAEATAE